MFDFEEHLAGVLKLFRHGDPDAEKWAMIVRESHLLFVSWPVPVAQLRPRLPAGLEIDTYQSSGWITIEMLQTSMVRFRGLPSVPVSIEGSEMNVRTYVRCRGERGIHFLSMDCPGLLGTALARWAFKLPLREADVLVRLVGDNYQAESIRIEDEAEPARFAYSGRISGPPAAVAPGSADEFLLNQTILFATDEHGAIYRARVDHRPHVVQPIDGVIEVNTLVSALVLTLPADPPIVRYCPGDDSLAYPMTRLDPAP